MKPERILNRAVIVGALGCFVDSYDLILFSMLRIPSLHAIGVPAERIVDVGIDLLNLQMLGMLVGGIVWGVLGDKRGRVSVLFGSIFLYSVATLCNAFVSSVPLYGLLRFLAGAGLAGEVGAAVTLVSEVMGSRERGYGTMLVVFMGAVGGLVAALVAESVDWRTCYLLGGVLGFALLASRLGMRESVLFHKMAAKLESRGDIRRLLTPPRRFFRYLACVLMGLPIWYVLGVLIGFSPEIGEGLGMRETVSVPRALFFAQFGVMTGYLMSTMLSHRLASRKKALLVFLCASAVFCAAALSTLSRLPPWGAGVLFYLLGLANGYWAVFVTLVAESFGTNLRSTAAISVPNFVRAALILLVIGLQFLKPAFGIVGAAACIGVVTFALAFLGFAVVGESYGKDLNYLET